MFTQVGDLILQQLDTTKYYTSAPDDQARIDPAEPHRGAMHAEDDNERPSLHTTLKRQLQQRYYKSEKQDEFSNPFTD